jgi:CRP-like cAMP-binding protein
MLWLVIPVNERMGMLRRANVATGVGDGELRALATAVDVCEVGAGDVLIAEGSPARQSFVVMEGVASIDSGGVVVAMVGPGSFIDALGADHRPVGATAQTPMIVLVVTPLVADRFGLGLGGSRHAAPSCEG